MLELETNLVKRSVENVISMIDTETATNLGFKIRELGKPNKDKAIKTNKQTNNQTHKLSRKEILIH